MAEREAAVGAEKRGYLVRGQFFAAPAPAPGLYVVATPIGNLSDITIRALDTLAGADLVACEDTRVTRRLLDRYGIAAKPIAYHEHSRAEAHARLLAALGEGRSVALVSDAGTPLVSDPGYQLVVDAAAAGHAVVPIPGPSSLTAALSAAGLPTDAVLFLGFPPAKAGARHKRFAELGRIPATLAFLEAPHRLAGSLADAEAAFGAKRQAVVCRELTKVHETFDRGTLGELSARYADGSVKGEIVLLVAPPGPAEAPAEAEIDTQLRAALAEMSVNDAARFVAETTGLPRRDLYRRALALKDAGR
jgi:16S rRNA (cytidine1402-2'-O)-methyltransferase